MRRAEFGGATRADQFFRQDIVQDEIAAKALLAQQPQGAEVGLSGLATDFFAIIERDLAFPKGQRSERPGQMAFAASTRPRAAAMLALHADPAGLLVVRVTPNPKAAEDLRRQLGQIS